MYLIPEVLSLWANAQLQNGLAGGMGVDAVHAVLLVRVRVKCDPGDEPFFDELACAGRGDMSHAPVKLHDADDFCSVATLPLMRDAIQSAWGPRDACQAFSGARLDFEVAVADRNAVAQAVECPKRHKRVADGWCVQHVFEGELGLTVSVRRTDDHTTSAHSRELLAIGRVQEDRMLERAVSHEIVAVWGNVTRGSGIVELNMGGSRHLHLRDGSCCEPAR